MAALVVPVRRPTARRALGRGLGVLVVLLLAACVLSLVVGSRAIGWSSIVDALRGVDTDAYDVVLIRSGRLPRTVVGVAVGAALGLAGTVMQGMTRNPLADPGLLGVNAGAAFALVAGIVFFGATNLSEYVWFAFGGAALAAVAVFLIGSRGPRGASPTSLALAGAAISALLVGCTSLMLLRSVSAFDDFRRWTVGSLAGRDGSVLVQVLPYLVGGAVLALVLGRMLNVLTLGEEVARSLGQHPGRVQLVAGLSVVLLCGTATSIAGPIAFVGLAVPHAARLVTGPDFRWILPYAMLLAPTLLLLADVLGRVVAPPGELQVGVVTALIGAPVFIALVRHRRVSEL
jgi:iron complex transport system permease protein